MMRAQPYEIDAQRAARGREGGASSIQSNASNLYNQQRTASPLNTTAFASSSSPLRRHSSGGNTRLTNQLDASSPSRKASTAAGPSGVQSSLKDLLALDTVPVRQAEDRQIVEEHYLEELKRAMGQANKADSDCDDARRRVKQLRAILEAVTHKKHSTAAIVQDHKTRLEGMMGTVDANRHAIAAMDNKRQRANEERAAQEREKQAQIEKTLSGQGHDKNSAYSLDAIQYEVECEERRVMSLRQRHSDSHQLAKEVRADVELLTNRLRIAEKRRSELETARLQLTAIEANAGFRDASASYNEYQQLMAKVAQQQKDISATRVEAQSMVLHLIEGAKTRSEAILKERRRLIDQYKKRFGPLQPSTEETLTDLLHLNSTRRSELVSLIVNSAAEKEALEQYIGVLSERCNNLLKQLQEAEANAAQSSPARQQLRSVDERHHDNQTLGNINANTNAKNSNAGSSAATAANGASPAPKAVGGGFASFLQR